VSEGLGGDQRTGVGFEDRDVTARCDWGADTRTPNTISSSPTVGIAPAAAECVTVQPQ
jgi:hypothetical protein